MPIAPEPSGQRGYEMLRTGFTITTNTQLNFAKQNNTMVEVRRRGFKIAQGAIESFTALAVTIDGKTFIRTNCDIKVL